jgi:hypothetical protein
MNGVPAAPRVDDWVQGSVDELVMSAVGTLQSFARLDERLSAAIEACDPPPAVNRPQPAMKLTAFI